MKRGDRRIINGWAFYDWANSAFPLVITTAIFPIFYANETTRTIDGKEIDTVTLFGFEFTNTVLKSYTLALAFLIIALISPFLSGIADHIGRKKLFLKSFCYTGATACALLSLFQVEYLSLGMLSFLIATIGFWGSLVFYNAFLPEIAEEKDQDRVSAKGFSLGYIGSSILLILCLCGVMFPGSLGFSNAEMPTRLSFVLVGLWWAGFAQVTFSRLPDSVYPRKKSGNPFTQGFKELQGVWRELKELPALTKYLTAFFVFNTGVQTVMLVAVDFGKKEIDGIQDDNMIIAVLLIQFVAIGGAYFFSALSSWIWNIKALGTAILIWVLVCMLAYFIVTPTGFYVLAALVGFVMGGIQSLARSTYSKYLPETKDHASFFSFYDVSEKIGIMTGLFIYGSIEELTGSMRNSVLFLIAIFVLGAILLMRVPARETE
ncbi:MAG: MFS transporter [Flavobacteriales bacterium]